eukprot:XP_014063650.1 PREDICTED: leucine-rich repeats and immunoglobulin-like domains protein 3 [Salmo salar]
MCRVQKLIQDQGLGGGGGGTLADRQNGYIPSESGSGNHQFMASSMSGFYMQPKDMNGLCQLDTGSEVDMEAAIDPLLCHYQGPISSLLRRGNMYTGEPSEAFTGCAMDQRPICIDSYSGSLTSSKGETTIRVQEQQPPPSFPETKAQRGVEGSPVTGWLGESRTRPDGQLQQFQRPHVTVPFLDVCPNLAFHRLSPGTVVSVHGTAI